VRFQDWREVAPLQLEHHSPQVRCRVGGVDIQGRDAESQADRDNAIAPVRLSHAAQTKQCYSHAAMLRVEVCRPMYARQHGNTATRLSSRRLPQLVGAVHDNGGGSTNAEWRR
jgi:hypothetical protein